MATNTTVAHGLGHDFANYNETPWAPHSGADAGAGIATVSSTLTTCAADPANTTCCSTELRINVTNSFVIRRLRRAGNARLADRCWPAKPIRISPYLDPWLRHRRGSLLDRDLVKEEMDRARSAPRCKFSPPTSMRARSPVARLPGRYAHPKRLIGERLARWFVSTSMVIV